jgi:hypothetical protein
MLAHEKHVARIEPWGKASKKKNHQTKIHASTKNVNSLQVYTKSGGKFNNSIVHSAWPYFFKCVSVSKYLYAYTDTCIHTSTYVRMNIQFQSCQHPCPDLNLTFALRQGGGHDYRDHRASDHETQG